MLRASHHTADGFSYYPLATELDELLAQGTLDPPSRSALRVLSRRLERTLLGLGDPERISFRGGLVDYRESEYLHTFIFDEYTCAELAQVQQRIQVPVDLIVLALLLVAFARTRGEFGEHAEDRQVTVYAPMRDGSDEPELVGLFSDWHFRGPLPAPHHGARRGAARQRALPATRRASIRPVQPAG